MTQRQSTSLQYEDRWRSEGSCCLRLNDGSRTSRLENDVIKSLKAIDMNFFCGNHAS